MDHCNLFKFWMWYNLQYFVHENENVLKYNAICITPLLFKAYFDGLKQKNSQKYYYFGMSFTSYKIRIVVKIYYDTNIRTPNFVSHKWHLNGLIVTVIISLPIKMCLTKSYTEVVSYMYVVAQKLRDRS
jgi:hypothetical protein